MSTATEKPAKPYDPARQLGRVDNATWARWKEAAKAAGKSFTEFAAEAIEAHIQRQAGRRRRTR